MRTRTPGILCDRSNKRTVNKEYKGERIFARLGRVSQDEAETWLRARQAEIDARREDELRKGDEQLFAAAAQKYLTECKQREIRTLDLVAGHVNLLLPHIGRLPLREVCNDALEGFKKQRVADGVKASTINHSLEVVRTVLNRAARVWRTDGKPWLSTPPLIEMLDERAQRRLPYPITWSEQAALLKHLPAHLQRMVLFAVNCGARDENVCKLRWAWERKVPELKRSVFVVPSADFKSQRPHVVVLNDVAWGIVEECRGQHDEFVFVWRRERVKNIDEEPAMPYRPIDTMNNSGFQKARRTAGLERVRVHDLRHTFGQRLRDAGVAEEDRALLSPACRSITPPPRSRAWWRRPTRRTRRATVPRSCAWSTGRHQAGCARVAQKSRSKEKRASPSGANPLF